MLFSLQCQWANMLPKVYYYSDTRVFWRTPNRNETFFLKESGDTEPIGSCFKQSPFCPTTQQRYQGIGMTAHVCVSDSFQYRKGTDCTGEPVANQLHHNVPCSLCRTGTCLHISAARSISAWWSRNLGTASVVYLIDPISICCTCSQSSLCTSKKINSAILGRETRS